MEDVQRVSDAGTAAAAWRDPEFRDAAVVVLDSDFPGGRELIRQVREVTDAQVVVCAEAAQDDDVLAAIEAGAVGYLSKMSLTPESLAVSVRAAASGTGVMAGELLGTMLRGIQRRGEEDDADRPAPLSRLTQREQEVLRLVADGHPTREVAARLCYSERTIKNVIHDAVTKLNARTRSQAVALAVRDGLI
jgi:DNA-binding NarL/FixJ family response regulator